MQAHSLRTNATPHACFDKHASFDRSNAQLPEPGCLPGEQRPRLSEKWKRRRDGWICPGSDPHIRPAIDHAVEIFPSDIVKRRAFAVAAPRSSWMILRHSRPQVTHSYSTTASPGSEGAEDIMAWPTHCEPSSQRCRRIARPILRGTYGSVTMVHPPAHRAGRAGWGFF
jgi:hypothetical protein